ncbi:hypothetical protein IWW51_006033, partial [Coemansia sp. RSA 2702]
MGDQITNSAAALGAMQLFLEEYSAPAVEQLLMTAEDVQSLEIDMHELLEFNHELAMLLLESPQKYLPLFNQACVAVQRALKQAASVTANICSVKED